MLITHLSYQGGRKDKEKQLLLTLGRLKEKNSFHN